MDRHRILVDQPFGVERWCPIVFTAWRPSAVLRQRDVQSRVSVFGRAVFSEGGSVLIQLIEGQEKLSSPSAMADTSIAGKIIDVGQVGTKTIDQSDDEFSLNPGLMTVDTKAFDHLVFDCAKSKLAWHQPVIISDLSKFLLYRFSSLTRAIVERFQALGYLLTDPMRPGETQGHCLQ